MKMLSTGDPSTLGSYRKLTEAMFGSRSPALAWIDEMIDEDPDGEDAEVIADEGQMIYAIVSMHKGRAE